MKDAYSSKAENYIWVDVQVGDKIYACLWCIVNVWSYIPVSIGETVIVQRDDVIIGEGTVMGFFDRSGDFEINKVYQAHPIPVMLNSEDYVWVTVSSDSVMIDDMTAIWQKLDDDTPKPVKLGDIVEYARKDGYGRFVGRVTYIGPLEYPEMVNEKFVRWANPYTGE